MDQTVRPPGATAAAETPDLKRRVRSLRLPADPAPGRRGLGWRAWLLTLALTGAGAYMSYPYWDPRRAETDGSRQAAPSAAPTPRPQTLPVATGAVSDGGEVALEAKGYVVPARQILISPKVSGMIQRLHIVEGQRVARGDVLAELEQAEYQADVDRAQAGSDAARQKLDELKRGFRPEEIDQAKAELAEAQVQLEQATTDWRRKSALWRQHAISQEEFDTAQSQMRALERRVERLTLAARLLQIGAREERIQAAAAEVRQAEAELAKAKWRLDNTTIRAPISGTILRKNAEEGNIVNPIAFNGSYSICEMADLSDMEVELTIQERDIARVFPGQQCRIRADAFADRVYSGRVSRVMPIADRAKGAVPVRVKIAIPAEEEGVYLKPEMGAVVSFWKGSATAGGSTTRQADGRPAPPSLRSQAK